MGVGAGEVTEGTEDTEDTEGTEDTVASEAVATMDGAEGEAATDGGRSIWELPGLHGNGVPRVPRTNNAHPEPAIADTVSYNHRNTEPQNHRDTEPQNHRSGG